MLLVTHFNEVYEQVGVGRLAVRQLGRPVLLIITAAAVWYHAVLPRDIGMRTVAALAGGAYLVLFGLIGSFLVRALTESVHGRPVYAIQWSVIYMGISLLAFAYWGYGPETTLQRAERLMAAGRFDKAVTAVGKALEEDPLDEDALELERTLRDMMRYG